MPLVATRGAASAQGFGEFAVAAIPNYIEEVFSTYLYTGSNSAKTITNNIDLSTKGGLVWTKVRTTTYPNCLTDTIRGGNKQIFSNAMDGSIISAPAEISSFNTTGYTLDGPTVENIAGQNFVGWTFRKQPKFFDVVTYTGTGSNTTIAHNLGAVPGSIIVKRTDTTADWAVYHRSLANTQYLVLNTTAAVATGATWWNSTTPTSTVFSVGTDASVNASGGTYVAYLFAHDAGGFGLTGTDNVISCGSFTTDSGGNATVTLGYEPAWLMFKCSSNAGQNWNMLDTMRGWSLSTDFHLEANSPVAEDPGGYGNPTSTGFVMGGQGNTQTYIYIAIRRGPMKVPTLGTSVYMGATRTGNGAVTALTAAGFPPDLYWSKSRAGARDHAIFDRLRGPLPLLSSNSTQNEIAYTDDLVSFDMTGVTTGTDGSTNGYNQNAVTYVNWYMRRAPSFFDEVCYTGTGVRPLQLSHNLGAVPELMIVKIRATAAQPWFVYSSALGNTQYLSLNTTAAFATSISAWSNTTPTSTTFTVGDFDAVNGSTNYTYVAYLFATCAGVSKVGSYTGTGATQTIDCGFGAGGSRFVLIKRTDSTGDWYVWDSARGMISGTDPSLLLNSTAAEVNANSVYAISTGFQIVSTAAGINASAGTYIFLSVA